MEAAMAIAGFAFFVVVMAMAIRILRQPVYRYQGDRTPQERRSFRETMLFWLTGQRN
jgi:hypothetical protein